MAGQIKIRCTMQLRWLNESGGKCRGCGDMIFLKRLDLYVEVAKQLSSEPLCSLCQSCGEVFVENWRPM